MAGMTATTTDVTTSVEGFLHAARTRVAPALRDAVRELPGPGRRIAGYHRGWHEADGTPLPSPAGAEAGGKAVRPALVFLSARRRQTVSSATGANRA
jgi:geranylgeranyl diphosphate synthase type I